MKHVKRVLALLLAMSMLLTMAVFAEEVTDVLPTPEAETEAPAEESTETPEEESTEAPAEESTGVPEGETTGAPAEESTEAPEDESAEAPEDGSAEAAEGESTEAPEDESAEAPEDESTEAPEGEATDAPEDESAEAPEDAPATDAEDAPAGDEAPAEDEESVGGEAPAGFGYTVSFENGVLVLNRIRTDCKHAEDGYEIEKGTDRHILAVAPFDAKQHKVTYQTYDYERCTNCQLYISYVVGAVEVANEDHAWNNGYCSTCSYSCKHTVTNWVPDGDAYDDYETLNSKQCQLFTEQSYSGSCDICGKEQSETRYTPKGEPADHVFNEYGSCTNCRYYPSTVDEECPNHPEGHDFEESSRNILSYRGTFKPKDDKVHIHKDYVLEISYRCKNCDATKTEDEFHFGEEIEEEHNISNGVCFRCGYVAPECTHPNAEFRWSGFKADLGVEAVQSNGDGTHTGKWIQVSEYYCPDCYESFNVESIMEGIYPCDFDYDTNICEVCGFECTHPNAYSDIYSRAPSTSNEAEMQNAKAVDDGNGRTHTWNCYYRVTSVYCPICHYSDSSTERVDAPYTDYHTVDTYDNPDAAKCSVCDGTPSVVVFCKHETTTTTTEQVDDRLIPKDADSHYVTYESVTTCDKCGYTVSRSDPEKREAKHSWNDYGICKSCGYVCKHEGYDTTTVENVFVGTEKCTSVDKDTHTRNGRNETQVQCTHCGAAVSRTVTQEDASLTTEHTFDDGVCRYCGYVCDHEGYERKEYDSFNDDDMKHRGNEGYAYMLTEYTPEGSSGHSYYRVKETRTECEHCYKVFSISFDPNWKQTEPHTIKNGVCAKCGYVSKLIQDAAPEDKVHNSDQAQWTVNPDGYYDHSTPQTIVTITLQEDGWVEWNINLIGGGNYGSGRKFLKAGESFDITWTGTDEQHYHPEGLATFNVDITVTTSDGQVTDSWSTDYRMNYTHTADKDVPTQTSGNNPGANGGNSGSTGSDMPKTGEREVSAATWLLLAACAFVGLLLTRKLRRD